MTLSRTLQERIARVAADRMSGATALVLEAVAVLREAVRGMDVEHAAAALIRAQPAMAGIRTAAALALGPEPDDALARLDLRLRQAAAATTRLAVPFLQLRRAPARELTIVTCSRSSLVEAILLQLGQRERTRVCCAESRPGLEGERLASALAAAGLRIDLYSDAAIGTALPRADAVLVGADALSSRALANKAGTAALAALARVYGTTVIVVAGREKILPQAVFDRLSLGGGRKEEGQTDGVVRREVLFEEVPAGLVDHVVLDRAIVTPDEVDSGSMWSPPMLRQYMSLVDAYNVLDSG